MKLLDAVMGRVIGDIIIRTFLLVSLHNMFRLLQINGHNVNNRASEINFSFNKREKYFCKMCHPSSYAAPGNCLDHLCCHGRAIAQAVSRRLPTAGARGSHPGLVMWDFVMDKSSAGAGFF
jgi:hypothetical protein